MLYFPKWFLNVKYLLWSNFLPFDINANILKCTIYMWIKNVIQKFFVFMTKIIFFILVQFSFWQTFLETHFYRYIMKCISLQCVFTFDNSSAFDLTFDIFVTLDSTYFICGNVQSKECRLHYLRIFRMKFHEWHLLHLITLVVKVRIDISSAFWNIFGLSA